MPAVIVAVVMHYRHKHRLLALEEKKLLASGGSDGGEAAKRLSARVEHLENVVWSVDFELNQRLSRLSLTTSNPGAAALASPAPAAPPALAAAPPPPGATLTG